MIPPKGFESAARAANLIAIQVTACNVVAGALFVWWKLRKIGITLAELRNPTALSAERRRVLDLDPIIQVTSVERCNPRQIDEVEA